MKKTLRSVLSAIVVICLLSTSLFTGSVSALSDSAVVLREEIVAAINGLNVTADTTAANIESAVASVDSEAEISWKIPFTKILPTDGAIITLNGEPVANGTVRGYAGSIKGIITVTSGGATFDAAVDFTLEPEYETIDCTKKAVINNTDGTYATSTGYDPEADLVVINRTSGGWNITADYFGATANDRNDTIKAIIVETSVATIYNRAFQFTRGLQAVVLTNARNIETQAFWASGVRYIDFGGLGTTYISFKTDSFGYTALENVYIGNYTYVDFGSNAFSGSRYLNQMTVDLDVGTVSADALNTYDKKYSITTMVCNNATAAAKFEGKAAAVIDKSTTSIVDYYSAVSKIKVVEDATTSEVVSASEALDTENAFTVSAVKSGNVFEVSITDANSVTATAYVKIFAVADMKNNIESLLNEYPYTDGTVQSDVTAYIQGVLGSTYTINWLEDYSLSGKVNGARVYARATEEDEYTLRGTVPGQDKAAHGKFVISKGTTSTVIEMNAVIEAAEYEEYHLTGIQTTNGAGINNNDTTTNYYDGSSELVIVDAGSIWGNHLNGTKIDNVLGAGTSDNIKAVIVKGNPGTAWTCVVNLKELEVLVIDNTSATEIGNGQFASNAKLKYVYIPNNITTARMSGNGSSGSQDAFINCTSLKNILVPEGFATNTLTTNASASPKIYVNAVTRYTEDASARQLINFYNEVSDVSSAASEEELQSIIEGLPDYSEDYETDIELTESGFKVTIDNLFVVNVPLTTPQGIKRNVGIALSDFAATNATTANDISTAILSVSGVESVEWSNDYGFEKILATNGAQITLNGDIVEGGIVRGHYGSITGVITVTTAFGDEFDTKVNITIDPKYETIDCSKVATVTVTSDSDTYSAASGYDPEADLVIININNPTNNIPVSYFGATNDTKNTTIKAVIVKDEVSTVLQKAFQHTSSLEAVVFKEVEKINNYGFYASGVKYVEFGSAGSSFTFGSANAFAWCSGIESLYIENRDSVEVLLGAFVGCRNLAQIYVDAKNVISVTSGAINTNSNQTTSVTTVVCNGADAVSKFEAAGAMNVIDTSEREISIYDVNNDFETDIRDLVRLKKLLIDLSEDTDYDLNEDGAVDTLDFADMRRVLLGVQKESNVIYVGNNTKVSSATTISNFAKSSSVSDTQAIALRSTILNSEDTINVSGNTWYISNDGDDTNAGNSPDAAWKTLSALTRYSNRISAGDAVLFRRGDIFRGSFTAVSGVSYGAYGIGEKPCIYGCKMNYAEESWVRTENENIYSLVVDTPDIGMIIFNHGEAYGYKMMNSVSECNHDYEFYHDKDAGVIYLYCSNGRPGELFYDIELLYNRQVVQVANGAHDVYIENISVKYGGAHGISVGMPVSDITIKNCEVGWIGGSQFYNTTRSKYERYGNGIQFYGQTTDAVVDHCWVYQCYDAGLTHQYGGSSQTKMYADNIAYTNNLVECCSYSLEYFWHWDVNGEEVYDDSVYMKDILVEDNIMRFAGYGIGQVRPDPINMGHVVTWNHYNTSNNFVIRNNIFDMSTFRLFALMTFTDSNPVFTGNTYVQSSNNVLGIAYTGNDMTHNKVNGGEIALNAAALSEFDSTGTLTVVE